MANPVMSCKSDHCVIVKLVLSFDYLSFVSVKH